MATSRQHPLVLPRQDLPAGQGLEETRSLETPPTARLLKPQPSVHQKRLSLSLSLSLTLSCLKDVHGSAGAESLGPFAYVGGLGMTPEHWLSDFARFYISAHGSNFCRNSDKGASGPGTSLLQLPVAASAHPGQPHVLTSTTGTSALCGNRAQGQGLPPHPDSWAPPCLARDSATTDKVAAKFRCPVSSGVSNICKCP